MASAADKKKIAFLVKFYTIASILGKGWKFNPVIILTHAAAESGWGTSRIAIDGKNLFGITKGSWQGPVVPSGTIAGLFFRKYGSYFKGVKDYLELISTYEAGKLSDNIEDFARSLSQSPYLSEKNGDNREAYRKMLVSIHKDIVRLLPDAKSQILKQQLSVGGGIVALLLIAFVIYRTYRK